MVSVESVSRNARMKWELSGKRRSAFLHSVAFCFFILNCYSTLQRSLSCTYVQTSSIVSRFALDIPLESPHRNTLLDVTGCPNNWFSWSR
jgi:hypothetical protein